MAATIGLTIMLIYNVLADHNEAQASTSWITGRDALSRSPPEFPKEVLGRPPIGVAATCEQSAIKVSKQSRH
jgi:hypothetical protein